MDKLETMYTIVYGEMMFGDTCEINRIVGAMEVPQDYTEEAIIFVDKMGYDWICLQELPQSTKISQHGIEYSLQDFYNSLTKDWA